MKNEIAAASKLLHHIKHTCSLALEQNDIDRMKCLIVKYPYMFALLENVPQEVIDYYELVRI
jgi:hypothetical protein